MLFNSFSFLIFFPIVTLLYFLLPHKWRWLHLLIASCLFYAAFIPAYLLILVFTILIDYTAGILIEQSQESRRKFWLILSIVANVGVLTFFKYYNFFTENIYQLLPFSSLMPLLKIALPIGLSFHTFQAMSYTIEVYKRRQKAEHHLGIYALYVMYYPQLVAGPIERPQNMLPQFHKKITFSTANLITGLRYMLLGMFMKVVIADRLGLYVDAVYDNVINHNGTSLLMATVFFSFQIYCDFAGYSLIAIGASKTMGIDLMTNFRRPYFAKSVHEFWQRWHISLSTWFRDYVYIPLGGNRKERKKTLLNILIVFLLSGLWHGANWTFIVWGGLNGIFLILAQWIRKKKGNILHKLPPVLSILTTFVLINITWIFFRAKSISEAFIILRKILFEPGKPYMVWGNMAYALIGLAALLIFEWHCEYKSAQYNFAKWRPSWRYTLYTIIIIWILLLGVFDGGQFIYFQF